MKEYKAIITNRNDFKIRKNSSSIHGAKCLAMQNKEFVQKVEIYYSDDTDNSNPLSTWGMSDKKWNNLYQ